MCFLRLDANVSHFGSSIQTQPKTNTKNFNRIATPQTPSRDDESLRRRHAKCRRVKKDGIDYAREPVRSIDERSMSGGCAACCAKDDANTQSSGSPSNLKDVRTRRTSHDGERGHRVTPTSLASLAGFTPSPGAEQLRDDPATQYGSGVTVRASASDAADPGAKKKFDPNKFKRRIGDHLAAAVIEQQQRGEEERPLLANASASKGSESRRADADVELGVPVASREGEEKLSKKEKKKREIQLRRQEMRLAQRRCWKMLVAVMFAVILVAAALFSGGFSGLNNPDANVAPREIQEYNASYIERTDEDTGLSAASTSDDPEDVRLKSTQASQEQFDSVGELEGDEEKKPDESAYEYDDADDFNDPNLRTMAPKVWRKRQKMLDKVKRNARKDAKREVRDFVKNAHDVLGVKEEVKEQDYDDALIERIESSPGVTVEKRKTTKESPFEDEDGEDAALVAAQASTLSNNLITDTIDSTRHLHKLATIGPDDEHGEDVPSSKSSKNKSIQSSSSEKDDADDADDEKKKRSASQSQAGEEKKKEDVKKEEADDKDKEESGSDKKERDDETKVKDEKKVAAAEPDDDEDPEPDFELPPASRAWRAM